MIMSPKSGEYLEIGEFLEEMVATIEKRMSRHEKSIAEMRSEISRLKAAIENAPDSGVKIDKSVLKILKQ